MPRPPAPLTRATLLLFACAAYLCACTSLNERGEISVAIAADAEVRTKVEEVVALVEVQASDSGWTQIAMRRIEVTPSTPWPIAFIATSASRSGLTGTYQLTASARDAHGAVVAQARAIREFRADASHLSLELRFEAACMFRAQPCGSGSTCHEAESNAGAGRPRRWQRRPAAHCAQLG